MIYVDAVTYYGFAVLFIIAFILFLIYANLYLRESRRAGNERNRRIKLEERIKELAEGYENKRKAKNILATATKFYKEGEENE